MWYEKIEWKKKRKRESKEENEMNECTHNIFGDTPFAQHIL
jgi:hypothetical protein